jgi:hypothetical protein
MEVNNRCPSFRCTYGCISDLLRSNGQVGRHRRRVNTACHGAGNNDFSSSHVHIPFDAKLARA